MMANDVGTVCRGAYCLEVEIADNFLKKALGLMFRNQLDENKGMLFPFKKEKTIPIWMFGARIPLDIIWIGSNRRIAHIKRNAKPCAGLLCPAIYPPIKAKYVLEVNAGVSDNFETGQELTFYSQ